MSSTTDQPKRVVLTCPLCAQPHEDLGEWAERPHRTHRCVGAFGSGCGHEWRIEGEPTVGVPWRSAGGAVLIEDEDDEDLPRGWHVRVPEEEDEEPRWGEPLAMRAVDFALHSRLSIHGAGFIALVARVIERDGVRLWGALAGDAAPASELRFPLDMVLGTTLEVQEPEWTTLEDPWAPASWVESRRRGEEKRAARAKGGVEP